MESAERIRGLSNVSLLRMTCDLSHSIQACGSRTLLTDIPQPVVHDRGHSVVSIGEPTSTWLNDSERNSSNFASSRSCQTGHMR